MQVAQLVGECKWSEIKMQNVMNHGHVTDSLPSNIVDLEQDVRVS
jgi:hypothetical protein